MRLTVFCDDRLMQTMSRANKFLNVSAYEITSGSEILLIFNSTLETKSTWTVWANFRTLQKGVISTVYTYNVCRICLEEHFVYMR